MNFERICVVWAVAFGVTVWGATCAAQANEGDDIRAVPVVMEEATVRGKVAVLETRWEDRQILEGLRVQVWSTKEAEPTERRRRGRVPPRQRDVLIHETETDDLGMFDLKGFGVGEYLLTVSDVQFRLMVIPRSADRIEQSEPKTLLILVPKEVVGIERQRR